MFGLGHFEDAGNIDMPTPEIHAVMTAARAFRAGSQSFVNLSIYEQRMHRTLKEALRQLKEEQAERRALSQAAMDNAVRLLNAHEMKGLPYVPAADNFVYASAEIVSEAARRYRIQDSKLAEKAGFNLTQYLKMRQRAAGDLVSGDPGSAVAREAVVREAQRIAVW